MRFTTLLLLLLTSTLLHAEVKHVQLDMGWKTVDFAGKPMQGVAVNGQIPAPELRFTEGDEVFIEVHNSLDEPGAIHWHGLLVPYEMDGVPWISFPPIEPGATFTYHFTLRQSGTYWYHSHSKLHEQQGLYGAFIVEPQHDHQAMMLKVSSEYTVLLSDWINEDPVQVFRNLKKDGDWYKAWRPAWSFWLPAWWRADSATRTQIAMQNNHLQQMRMSPWDYADIAYDAYLFNGATAAALWQRTVTQGEQVRLRMIDGGSSTYFKVKVYDASKHDAVPFTVMTTDGQAIAPITAKRLLMGMAETYDIVVNINSAGPFYIYAESLDGHGAAVGALVTNAQQTLSANAVPPFNDPLFASMSSAEHAAHSEHAAQTTETPATATTASAHSEHAGMNHSGINMGVTSTADTVDYALLQSPEVTNNPDEAVTDITLHLTGDMRHYQWSFNDIRDEHAAPIVFEKGKVYRFTLINNTMMHHPIHIHGHWFVLDTGHGAHNPRKHTIDVPPFTTRVAKVTASESGRWVFHCHNLYHMMAGMNRNIVYSDFFAAALPATAAPTPVAIPTAETHLHHTLEHQP